MQAHNSADRDQLTALFAENAIADDLTQTPPVRTEGRDAVADVIVGVSDAGLNTYRFSGRPIQVGDYVSQAVVFVADDQPVGEGLVVFLFNSDNEITHQWISADLRLE